MAIQNVQSYIYYKGDGTKTTYEIPFKYFQVTDVKVACNSALPAWSVSGQNLNFASAPANNLQFLIYRKSAISRARDFADNEAIRNKPINEQLDYCIAIMREISDCFRVVDALPDLTQPDVFYFVKEQ